MHDAPPRRDDRIDFFILWLLLLQVVLLLRGDVCVFDRWLSGVGFVEVEVVSCGCDHQIFLLERYLEENFTSLWSCQKSSVES